MGYVNDVSLKKAGVIFSVIFRRMRLLLTAFLLQWTETNHTDLWFFDASDIKCLDLMNKIEHSDFDHCIKQLTVDSPLRKLFSFLTHQFCSRHVTLWKIYSKKQNVFIGL